MRLVLVDLLVANAGCAVLCDEYEGKIYSCEPLPAGSAGCVGGPLGLDPKKTLRFGCTARVPECPSDDGHRSFNCTELEDGRWVWIEFL